MRTDVAEQIRDYAEYVDSIVPTWTAEDLVTGRVDLPLRPFPSTRRLHRPLLVSVAAAVFVLVVIGGTAWLIGSRDGDLAPVGTQPPSPSTSLTPATTAPPPEVTTTPPNTVASTPTTTNVATDQLEFTVPLYSLEQTRAGFLADLDADGWVSYTDEVVGWSIRYPADWTVGESTEPGRTLVLVTPSGETGLTVTLGLDAAPDDASSYDYHLGYIETAVAAGVFYLPFDDVVVYWGPVDVDFDGRFDPQDMTAVDLYSTVDAAGNPLPDGHPQGFVEQFVYYDPATEPAYVYRFETFGFGGAPLTVSRALDKIVLSFEPPAGYP